MEYIKHGMASPQSHEGTLMPGYSRVVLGNVVAYTNGKPSRERIGTVTTASSSRAKIQKFIEQRQP